MNSAGSILLAVSERALGSEEAGLIRNACAARGLEAEEVIWDTIIAPTGPVLVRHTWDYHRRVDEFRAWLSKLSATGATVFNPVEQILWNIDKRYLGELAEAGVETPRTIYVSRGGEVPPTAELMAELGGTRAIIKPTIGATSWQTRLVELENRSALEEAVRQASVAGHAMIQEFLPEVTGGEWSLVYFGGEFSHGVLKTPAQGEFRVQSDFGGAVHLMAPPTEVKAAADHCVGQLSGTPVFARVDGISTARGFVLMEVELIEPDLFLRLHPEAATRLVEVLVRAGGVL